MTEEEQTQALGEVKLPSAQELLEAGVPFGHKTSVWNPKMKPYIFTAKNGIHIFDLEKTQQKLSEAIVFMRSIRKRGGIIFFVGTKPAAKKIVEETAQALGAPYASKKWLGGTLTNFKTISGRLKFWRDLEEQKAAGQWEKFTKKERLVLQRKVDGLEERLEGIKDLKTLPQALFAVDVKEDETAIREAKKIGIPVVAICDSNANLSLIDYPIPANDDAVPTIQILLETIAQNLKDISPVPANEPEAAKTESEPVKEK